MATPLDIRACCLSELKFKEGMEYMAIINAAVINNNMVSNVIVLDETLLDMFANLLGADIIPALPLGLGIGDYTEDGGETWYRDILGVATQLPLPEEEEESEIEDMENALHLLGVVPEEGENG